jgi:hypothetical protein
MNGEARILQPEVPVNTLGIEKQPILGEKTAATDDSAISLPKTGSLKIEDRFSRLKRHLRKRSASIL